MMTLYECPGLRIIGDQPLNAEGVFPAKGRIEDTGSTAEVVTEQQVKRKVVTLTTVSPVYRFIADETAPWIQVYSRRVILRGGATVIAQSAQPPWALLSLQNLAAIEMYSQSGKTTRLQVILDGEFVFIGPNAERSDADSDASS